jgi:hypothetical protein
MTYVILWGCPLCSSSGEERYPILDGGVTVASIALLRRDIIEAHAAAKFDCPVALEGRFAFTISIDTVEAEA